MLILYETALGYCLFKVSNEAKLESADLYTQTTTRTPTPSFSQNDFNPHENYTTFFYSVYSL
jgi:hypothetical protein